MAAELWNGDKDIAFFVHSGRFYWVFDEKFNFNLDAEKEYRAYLEKGHIDRKQCDAACLSFRGQKRCQTTFYSVENVA